MLKKIILFIAFVLLIQLIKIDVVQPKTVDTSLELKAPHQVMNIIKTSCYDCHSYQTKIPWYGDIAPVSWEVRGHINDARAWLNFQKWKDYSDEKKQRFYKGIYKTVGKTMPLPMYLTMHKDAKLTKTEEATLKEWAKSHINEE